MVYGKVRVRLKMVSAKITKYLYIILYGCEDFILHI